MTVYSAPGTADSLVSVKSRYGHFIGGEWVEHIKGAYFEDISPVNGKAFTEVARGTSEDIEAALDAAHAAADSWGRASVTERSNVLFRIADRLEQNLEMLAVAEAWDNGKAVRETLAADLPLAVDHFRYFAGCFVPRRVRRQRSTRTPSPTTSMSRSAWSVRSSRGTSPS